MGVLSQARQSRKPHTSQPRRLIVAHMHHTGTSATTDMLHCRHPYQCLTSELCPCNPHYLCRASKVACMAALRQYRLSPKQLIIAILPYIGGQAHQKTNNHHFDIHTTSICQSVRKPHELCSEQHHTSSCRIVGAAAPAGRQAK